MGLGFRSAVTTWLMQYLIGQAVYSDGQKSCHEQKLRISLTLYKKCGIKHMFETEFETRLTSFVLAVTKGFPVSIALLSQPTI